MSDHQIRDLVEVIAKALSDHPEQLVIKEIIGQQTTVIELRAAKEDLGKIIGKEGRNAHALRTLVNAAATKLRKRAVLEILEQDERSALRQEQRRRCPKQRVCRRRMGLTRIPRLRVLGTQAGFARRMGMVLSSRRRSA